MSPYNLHLRCKELWGPSFPGGKDAPQAPTKDPRGREFRLSLPLDPHSHRPRRGGLRSPSPWNPPQVVLLSAIGPAPALRSGGRARQTPRPLQSKAEGSSCLRRTAWVGFQRVGAAAPALWSFQGRVRGGNRNPPSGFLRGFGGILCPKECLQKTSPPLLAGNKINF